ncbi:unnamed protein product [Bursaphelenchus okinawaensis]|uniref:PDZ domain-containing protein n=1 Tax=Bursaphelenchus okinawaensis TaxID=465554 RepID=A0A811K9A2_9BILA|nr:unnamed protein product [Bursaphelenchus okinawaensis]CAG9097452.1 unnamed protein product [Bursaphelenchus okinawaensis]
MGRDSSARSQLSKSAMSPSSAMSVATDKNATCAPYGIALPSELVKTVTVKFPVDKEQRCGIEVSPSKMIVLKVEKKGAGVKKIEFGDVIQAMNGESMWNGSKPNVKKFASAFKKLSAKGATCEITVLRPVKALPADTKRLPEDQREEGCSYKLAVVYRIGKRPLELGIVLAFNKIYVMPTAEFTCAGRCLEPGDAILDADGEPLTTLEDVADKIVGPLQEKGYVTLLVEQAEGPAQKSAVRLLLKSFKNRK